MSHAEYIAALDEDQLENLIDQAKARRENIQQSGWVLLWTVNICSANVAWFPEEERAAAVEFACNAARIRAARCIGDGVEMELSLERYRPIEAQDLLARRKGG